MGLREEIQAVETEQWVIGLARMCDMMDGTYPEEDITPKSDTYANLNPFMHLLPDMLHARLGATLDAEFIGTMCIGMRFALDVMVEVADLRHSNSEFGRDTPPADIDD